MVREGLSQGGCREKPACLWTGLSAERIIHRPMGGRLVLLTLTLGLLAGCASASEPSAQATCVVIADFEGQQYHSRNALVHPSPGAVLGDITIPGCNDTGGEQPPDESRSVASLPGVDKSVALVDAEIPEVIYVRADLERLPPEVERYFVAPVCRPEDAPIDLAGPWLSIPGTDANVEPDPVPPYWVEMLVASSSSSAYLDAELRILIPPSLGMPITHEDVEKSLWTGGTVRVSARCRGARFVADAVATMPP